MRTTTITGRIARTASIFAAAALVAGAAIPGTALASDPAAKATASPKVAAKPASSDPALDKRRYCAVDFITGSRLPRKTCVTRSEWIAATGRDPAKK